MHAIRLVALSCCLALASTAAGQTFTLTGRPTIGQAEPSAKPARTSPARPKPSRWAFTVHAGWTTGAQPDGGTTKDSFPVGTSFTTIEGMPSRAHSSWYFGDGAALFNDVAGQFGQVMGRSFTTLVPLDAALRTAGTRRRAGPVYGASLAYCLNRRLWLEGQFEMGPGITPVDAFVEAANRTSNAFRAAFTDVLSTAPVTGLDVTSVVQQETGSSRQMRIMGGLRWTVATQGALSLHAAFGGGLALNTGSAPRVWLSGDYRFSFLGIAPMHEADRVVVRFEEPDTSLVGRIGGGITYDVARRWGLRVDAGVLLGVNAVKTTVTATPSVTSSTVQAAIPSRTSPAIQFSTMPAARSSLSGGPLTLTTFESSGVAVCPQVTIGLVIRL